MYFFARRTTAALRGGRAPARIKYVCITRESLVGSTLASLMRI